MRTGKTQRMIEEVLTDKTQRVYVVGKNHPHCRQLCDRVVRTLYERGDAPTSLRACEVRRGRQVIRFITAEMSGEPWRWQGAHEASWHYDHAAR